MPLTILLAEDDEGTRLSICDYLELEGYNVVMAANGEEALRKVYDDQPQLIITDIGMPFLDGYSLIQKVRQHPPFRLLPVIFLTAHNETQDRIRGYQLGCDAFLPKPFELQEIGAIVRNLMERSQLIQAAWMHQVAMNTAQQRAIQGPASATAAAVAEAPFDEVEASSSNFTSREQDVLVLLSDGLSNAQIGDKLYLSPRTVEKYVSSLFRKTDTSNRAELLKFALHHHLVK